MSGDYENEEFGTAEVCPEGGEHVPDYTAVTVADGMPGVVDVPCLNCGRSGSARIDPDTIQW